MKSIKLLNKLNHRLLNVFQLLPVEYQVFLLILKYAIIVLRVLLNVMLDVERHIELVMEHFIVLNIEKHLYTDLLLLHALNLAPHRRL